MNKPMPNPHNRGGVVSVGRLYCDLVFTGLDSFPELGKEVFAGGISLSAGGGAYITAAYLASIERPAFICATLPQNPFGAAIAPELARNKVDLSGLVVPPEESGSGSFDPQLTVAVATRNDRAFITRRTGPSVPHTITATLDHPCITHLHIGELATLVDRPDLITMARDRGFTISLDCSWNESAIQDDAALGLIGQSDLFLPNEMEACALFGLGDDDIQFAARNLAKLDCLSVIKCGVEGAGIATESGLELTPAIQTEVVDTTGAGDAFNAGFLNAWLTGSSPELCLTDGVRCGSFAVGKPGGANCLPVLA
jgi:sugar/nucleoside kinase (ribokinase family)